MTRPISTSATRICTGWSQDETPARYATISQEPGHLEERLFAWRDQDGHAFRMYLRREQGSFKSYRNIFYSAKASL